MLNGINEESLPDDRYSIRSGLKITREHNGRHFWLYLPELGKKPDIITVHARTNDNTNNTNSFENY